MTTTTASMSHAQRRYVLEQHKLYGLLRVRIAELRRELDGGADVAEVLVREATEMLSAGWTREQAVAAAVSLMVRVARGEDMRPPAGVVDRLNTSSR